jgi:hypothetical protein
MTSDTLLRRLETEKEQAQQQVEQLRSKAAQIEKSLASLEEQLKNLEITQQTLTKLMESTERQDEPTAPDREDRRAGRLTSKAAQAEYGDTQIDGRSRPGGGMPPHQRSVPLFEHKPTLGPVSGRIQMLVCSSDQPLTPKGVTQALGRNAERRTNVESVRAALEKLASKGHLAKIGPGLFSAPQARQGGATYG